MGIGSSITLGWEWEIVSTFSLGRSRVRAAAAVV